MQLNDTYIYSPFKIDYLWNLLHKRNTTQVSFNNTITQLYAVEIHNTSAVDTNYIQSKQATHKLRFLKKNALTFTHCFVLVIEFTMLNLGICIYMCVCHQ